MQIPFTTEEFFGVFREYNEALWPAQAFLLGLAFAAIPLVLKPNRRSGVWISTILAFLWVWLAVAYHLSFSTRINPLAYVFSGILLAGSLAFFGRELSGVGSGLRGLVVAGRSLALFLSCSHSSCIQRGHGTQDIFIRTRPLSGFHAPPPYSTLACSRFLCRRIRAVLLSSLSCGASWVRKQR